MNSGCICLAGIGTNLRFPSLSILNQVKSISIRKIMLCSKSNAGNDHTFTVLVEGNIGSGKTSFLNYFSRYDALLLAEPVEQWRNIRGYNFLDLLYKDPVKWGLAFQTIVQKTMLDLHVQKTHKPIKLMERSIHSGRFCFVENLHRTKKLPSPDYTVLDEWYQWINKNMDVKADLIVYFRTEPEVVYQRIKARARPEESLVPLEYLQQLHRVHEDWLYHKTAFTCPAPVYVVDANKDLTDMVDEYKKCKQEIEAATGKQLRLIDKPVQNGYTTITVNKKKLEQWT